MADRPILFSGPMVRAIINGRKTQTRRVLHAQPPEWVNFCEQPQMFNVLHEWVPSGLWRWAELDRTRQRQLRQWPIDVDGSHYWVRPKFAVGDRLWVRETWAVSTIYDGMRPRDINPEGKPNWCGIAFPATREPKGLRRRSAIHMPRWASRLTLTVTDVRVEKLQDITEADAWAEGCEGHDRSGAYTAAYETYAELWDIIHGEGAWNSNPWIVALTFDVTKANIDAEAKAA